MEKPLKADGRLRGDAEKSVARPGPARAVAFLVHGLRPGTGTLAVQKEAVDAFAKADGLAIGTYLVELSETRQEGSWGPACCDLLLLARAGALDVVFLDEVGDLASGRDEAVLAAVELATLGVKVVEVSGSDPLTVARGRLSTPIRRKRFVAPEGVR